MPCLACPQWPEDELRDLFEILRSEPSVAKLLERLSDPHHVTSRGAGGGDIAENVMPLCREHHNEWDAPWAGPSAIIEKYPRVRQWLEVAGRQDILDRYTFKQPSADITQTTEED